MTEEHLPLAHVLVHVREALVDDARVGGLGLDADERTDDGAVVVRGSVSTVQRKASVVDVVRDVLRAHGVERRVVDETVVPRSGPPNAVPEDL